MNTDFSTLRKEAEKAGLLGSGDYLKLREGSNRLRLMTMCLPHSGEYQGRKTFKWLCYVVDRVDGKIKPFFMPHLIFKQIEGLQGSEDYAFNTIPMPYDLTINAKGAGTKEVEYTVVPARKNTPVTDTELTDLDQAKPLKELQAALLEKKTANQSAPVASHDDHGVDDSVPF